MLKRVCLNYKTDWWTTAGLRMHSPRICLVIPNQQSCLDFSENSENLRGTYSGMLLSNIVAKEKAPPTTSMWQMTSAVAIIRSILLLEAIILTTKLTLIFFPK